ncbi:TPA: low temperature requirement protein A [Streptococcus suis]
MHLEEVTVDAILDFIISNVTLLMVWVNEVFFYEKYGDSRRIDIFTVIALMFFLGNMALNFNMDFSSLNAGSPTVVSFNLLLITSYGVIALQYFWKGRVLGFNRDMKVNMGLMGIYIMSLIPAVLGWLDIGPISLAIYLLPLILPRFANHFFYKGVETKTNFPHAVERSQLVTILTFGEAVIAIISTYPITENLYQGALLFFGMALMFMFYMTQTFLAIDHHRPANVAPLFYIHILIFMGINFFTVGIEFLADHHHAGTGLQMFLIGVILFYIGTLLTTLYNQELYRMKIEYLAIFALGIVLFIVVSLLIGAHVLHQSILLIIFFWGISHYYMKLRHRIRENQNIPHPDPSQNHRDFN